MNSKDLPSAPLTLKIPCRALKHVVGTDRHIVACIEDHCGSFISISYYDANFGTLQIWAGQCELAKVMVLALSFGFLFHIEYHFSKWHHAPFVSALRESATGAHWLGPLFFHGTGI